MKTMTAAQAEDPVCGMTIDALKAAGKSDYKGRTNYFCSPVCLEKFEANPAEYITAEEKAEIAALASNYKITKPLKNEDVMTGRRNDHSTVDGTGERVDLPIT